MGINRTLEDMAVGGIVKAEVNGVMQNFIVVHKGKPSAIYSNTFNGATILLLEEAIWASWFTPGNSINDYAASAIHSNLNSLVSRFGEVIKNNIIQVKIPYRPGVGYSTGVSSGESGLAAKLWLPSGYELGWTNADSPYFPPDGAKFDYFLSGKSLEANNKRISYLNGVAVEHWLRSPYCWSVWGGERAWRVLKNGDGDNHVCSNTYNLRPALALPSTLFVSPSGILTEEAVNPCGLYAKRSGIWVPVV